MTNGTPGATCDEQHVTSSVPMKPGLAGIRRHRHPRFGNRRTSFRGDLPPEDAAVAPIRLPPLRDRHPRAIVARGRIDQCVKRIDAEPRWRLPAAHCARHRRAHQAVPPRDRSSPARRSPRKPARSASRPVAPTVAAIRCGGLRETWPRYCTVTGARLSSLTRSTSSLNGSMPAS